MVPCPSCLKYQSTLETQTEAKMKLLQLSLICLIALWLGFMESGHLGFEEQEHIFFVLDWLDDVLRTRLQ